MENVCVGVDEAGRGPLAGPLAVGVVKLCTPDVHRRLAGVTDSKVLTEAAREMWYRRIERLADDGRLLYTVVFIPPKQIDERGVGAALRAGVWRGLKQIGVDAGEHVQLDGGLAAPSFYKSQQTIVRGDFHVPVISAASVVAKVTRDRYMKRIARAHPQYGFDAHKGYGTAFHRMAIREHGPCSYHRMSFLRGGARLEG